MAPLRFQQMFSRREKKTMVPVPSVPGFALPELAINLLHCLLSPLNGGWPGRALAPHGWGVQHRSEGRCRGDRDPSARKERGLQDDKAWKFGDRRDVHYSKESTTDLSALAAFAHDGG